jgi:glycosyltransferase involved in cell wall biosynthesis
MINEVANQAFHLSQGLAKAGHQVKVILHESKKANISFLFNQRQIPGVKVCWLKGKIRKMKSLRIAFSLLREIISFKPHIIHIHFLRFQVLIATLAALFLHIPILGVAHGSDIRGSRRRYLQNALLRLIGRRIDKVILTARVLEKEAFMIPSKKLIYIPRIVDTDFFSPKDVPSEIGEKFEDNVILSVGRLIKIKTPVKLLRAFRQVVDKLPKAQLILLGIGPMKEELIKLTHTLSLSENVQFLGKIPNAELPGYYNLAKVESHGFSRAILSLEIAHLEALSSCKPVVTYIGEENLPGVISVYSEDEIATALLKVLKDRQYREKIGSDGRQYVIENFGIKSVTQKTLQLYESLLSK